MPEFQAIKGDRIPAGSIVLVRSDNGFHPQVLQAISARLPKDSLLLCLRNGESLEFLPEEKMNEAGWFRRPTLILPKGGLG